MNVSVHPKNSLATLLSIIREPFVNSSFLPFNNQQVTLTIGINSIGTSWARNSFRFHNTPKGQRFLPRLTGLNSRQRAQLPAGFQNIQPVRPGLVGLFQQQVQQKPHHLAIAYQQQTLSYQELNQQANQLAHYLIRQGLRPGGLVALWLDRSPQFIVALLAILKAGAAYLPLDTQYPAERLAFILEDAGVDLAILSTDSAEPALPCKTVNLPALDAQLGKESINNPAVAVAADSLAYVMYTSGTTGRPNGVEVTQAGIIRLVCQTDYFPFHQPHTFLQLASPSFDAATFEIWGALLHGHPCILYPGKVPELDVLEGLIEREKITCLWLTAALFNFIIDERPQMLQGVGWVLTGGEALSVPHIQKAQQLLPHTQLINGYGPTENTTFTCCYTIPRLNGRKLSSIPIGSPIANTQVYILNADLQPVSAGEIGEIYTGGAGLARGYRNRPQLTAQKFIANPFAGQSGERLYKTGDLGRWLPGDIIEFMGRVDHQVKIRGFRIEPGEIEQVILQDKAIRNCVVSVQEMGGHKELVAYVQYADPDCVNDQQALSSRLKSALPAYMVPAYVVALAQLPLNLNGKIDRGRLPLPQKPMAAQPVDEAPVTATEGAILAIWKDVFGNEAITVADNFFDLGGHSLLAAKLIARINKNNGVKLHLPALFEAPTVRALARMIDQKNEVRGYIIPLKPGTGQPVFLFAGLGGNPFSWRSFAQYHSSEEPLYGVFYPEVDQPFARLEDYVGELVREMDAITQGGSCSLIGYSLGGRVAFETAIQLQGAGKQVDKLCIVSAYPPEFYDKGETISSLLQFNYGLFKQSTSRLKRHFLHYRLPAFMGRYVETKVLKRPADVLGVQYGHEPILPLWKAYKSQNQFKGNLLLVKEHLDWMEPSFNEYYFSHIHPDLMWSKYIDGQIQVSTVSCGHDEFLLGNFVPETVSLFRSYKTA